MTSTKSYWMATAPPFADEPGAPETSYDVAILGAGLTGLTAALALARAGQKVAVFERGYLGAGASGRNGGHVNNGLAHSYAGVMRSVGAETARRLYHAFDAGIDRIEAIIAEEQIDCAFHRAGKLKLAVKASHLAALKANAALVQAEADPEVRFLEKEELAGEICAHQVHGAMLSPKSAVMHVGRYLQGLGSAVRRHGGQVFLQRPVSSFRREGTAWQIKVPGADLRAQHLILAGGATGAPLSPLVAQQILPISSYIIATRPLTDQEIAATLPGRRSCVTSLNVGSYFRFAPDNRLIFGGRARFSRQADARAAARSVPILRRTLEGLFPSLKGIEITHAFGGLVDMSRDRLPRLGQTPEGAHYAIGLSGHGVQISAFLGEALAAAVLDQTLKDCPFAALPKRPYPAGAALALPLIGAAARIKDLLP